MSSLREGNILSIKEETKTIHNSLSREDSIKSNGGYPVGEERASSRSSSTASGRLTREEVSSLMNSSYHEEEEKEEVLESFCHSIFDICDTDKDGYITINVRIIPMTKWMTISLFCLSLFLLSRSCCHNVMMCF